MGSYVAFVKGNLHMGFQVDRATTFFGFGKGGRQIGSQVNEERERERDKKKERKTRKRNRKKKKRIRFLDE